MLMVMVMSRFWVAPSMGVVHDDDEEEDEGNADAYDGAVDGGKVRGVRREGG